MFLCGTKNSYSVASLEEPFEAPLFLRVYDINVKQKQVQGDSSPFYLEYYRHKTTFQRFKYLELLSNPRQYDKNTQRLFSDCIATHGKPP